MEHRTRSWDKRIPGPTLKPGNLLRPTIDTSTLENTFEVPGLPDVLLWGSTGSPVPWYTGRPVDPTVCQRRTYPGGCRTPVHVVGESPVHPSPDQRSHRTPDPTPLRGTVAIPPRHASFDPLVPDTRVTNPGRGGAHDSHRPRDSRSDRWGGPSPVRTSLVGHTKRGHLKASDAPSRPSERHPCRENSTTRNSKSSFLDTRKRECRRRKRERDVSFTGCARCSRARSSGTRTTHSRRGSWRPCRTPGPSRHCTGISAPDLRHRGTSDGSRVPVGPRRSKKVPVMCTPHPSGFEAKTPKGNK